MIYPRETEVFIGKCFELLEGMVNVERTALHARQQFMKSRTVHSYFWRKWSNPERASISGDPSWPLTVSPSGREAI